MQAHGNTTRVVWELAMVLVGVPSLGLLTSTALWVRAGNEADANKRQYQRIGFASASFGFAVPLLLEALTALPTHLHTLGSVAWLPLLSIAGVLASAAAAVLLAVNARGLQRAAGTLLCLLGFGYCGLSFFAFLAGGGGL